MNYKILHIAVHLGGGVGSVLMNWIGADKDNQHTILCLNHNYYKKYDENIVLEDLHTDYPKLSKYVSESDVIVVHFWNHPMLYNLLITYDLPPSRICFWSHVSGLNAPYVFPKKLVNFSDKFIFASPISYNAREILQLPQTQKKKLGQIWTTGNINEYFKVQSTPHEGFNIGFIGTLDYSKLHPNFIDFCSKIDIPDVKFIICGDGCDAEKIKQQVKDKGLSSKFTFTGVIDDIKPYLSIIDVFGYPLNPTHFGTCEQVLGEAIAAGVIPVVMKNPAEEFILFKSIVRFVCNNEQEYIHNIKLLYENKQHQKSLISLIQENITTLYDSQIMVESWESVFKALISQKKRTRKWAMPKRRVEMGGAGIFIESLGKYGTIFENNNYNKIRQLYASNLQWYSNSKGSPKQYLTLFPKNKQLQEWVNLLE